MRSKPAFVEIDETDLDLAVGAAEVGNRAALIPVGIGGYMAATEGLVYNQAGHGAAHMLGAFRAPTMGVVGAVTDLAVHGTPQTWSEWAQVGIVNGGAAAAGYGAGVASAPVVGPFAPLVGVGAHYAAERGLGIATDLAFGNNRYGGQDWLNSPSAPPDPSLSTMTGFEPPTAMAESAPQGINPSELPIPANLQDTTPTDLYGNPAEPYDSSSWNPPAANAPTDYSQYSELGPNNELDTAYRESQSTQQEPQASYNEPSTSYQSEPAAQEPQASYNEPSTNYQSEAAPTESYMDAGTPSDGGGESSYA